MTSVSLSSMAERLSPETGRPTPHPELVDITKENLIKDGATILSLRGLTLPQQLDEQNVIRKSQDTQNKLHRKPLILDRHNFERAGDIPSGIVNVAIYTDPEKLFVPGTLGRSLEVQEKLMKQDEINLARQLNIPHMNMIIPESIADITDIVLQVYNETGIRLFGDDAYRDLVGFPGSAYARTKETFGASSKLTLNVGLSSAEDGLSLSVWDIDKGIHGLGVMRIIQL